MDKVYFEKDDYGTIRWFKENTRLLHREDGPALILATGYKSYWKNGYLHRTDGPAIILDNGDKAYYLNGIYYPHIKTNEEWIIFQIIN